MVDDSVVLCARGTDAGGLRGLMAEFEDGHLREPQFSVSTSSWS